MSQAAGESHAAALELAHLYRDCVECFGLIHQGRKEWDRAQRLLLTRLGIQQARLLAYGQIMGICELAEARDARLDEEATRETIMTSLKLIIERPQISDRVTQFEKYGLKPSKKLVESNEPSLDWTRLEAFREQYMSLEAARAPSVTANHWMIVDNAKFRVFIDDIKDSVGSLIDTMGIQDRVDQAIKSDIKALGWHPVFDRSKAANDSSKLRLIQDSCVEDYPEYSQMTTGALAYLNKQWQDYYQEAMERLNPRMNPYRSPKAISTKTNGKAPTGEPKENGTNATVEKQQKQKRSSIFSFFRSSKKRHSIAGISIGKEGSLSRQLHGHEQEQTPEPTRSQSESAVQASAGSTDQKVDFSDPFSKEMAGLETSIPAQNHLIAPLEAQVSRHDQLRASV